MAAGPGRGKASLADVLVALAENEVAVVLVTVEGRRHRGQLGGVGVDFCAFRIAGGTTLVAVEAVAEVRAVDAAGPRLRGPGAGDSVNRASLGVRLVDVLA